MEDARRAHAERIQREHPEAEVLEVTHDFRHEPWKVDRLQAVFECIVYRALEDFPPDASDFAVRKALLDDEEILRFKKDHPRLYYTLTDRGLMRQEKYRATLRSMLAVRGQVERGQVPGGERADAAATSAIMASLLPAGAAAAPQQPRRD